MNVLVSSLRDILFCVAQDSVSAERDGEFSVSDIIFANSLLQRTIRTSVFQDDPTAEKLSLLLRGLHAEDPEIFLWAEEKLKNLGSAFFATRLWITNRTLRGNE